MTRWEAISILSEVEQEYRHHPGPPPKGKTAWLSIPVENAMKILTLALESRIPREEGTQWGKLDETGTARERLFDGQSQTGQRPDSWPQEVKP